MKADNFFSDSYSESGTVVTQISKDLLLQSIKLIVLFPVVVRPLFQNVNSHNQFCLGLENYFRTLCSLLMCPLDDGIMWKEPGYFCPFKGEALLNLAPYKVKVLSRLLSISSC